MKDKTRTVSFIELKITEYLNENGRTSLLKLIFSMRSKTLDIKDWNPWSYSDNVCIACKKHIETIDHFMTCSSYKNDPEKDWHYINGVKNNIIKKIAKVVEKRVKERQHILHKEEAGLTPFSDSTAQFQINLFVCLSSKGNKLIEWFFY